MYCDNPQRIYNKYLQRYILVPCGKCDSCKITRSNTLALRINNECELHPYNIFFTLTYTNDNLPVITPSCDGVRSRNGRINFSLDDLDFADTFGKSLDILRKNFPNSPIYNYSDNTSVSVLYKRDLQNFIKRLRALVDYEFKDIKDEKKKRFRFFACGERGTERKRAHFHGILHCDDYELSQYLLSAILKAWKFCDWDKMRELEEKDGKQRLPSYVRGNGGAASYVASYLSGTAGNHDVMEKTKFRQFALFSKAPLYGCSKIERDILQHFVDGNDDGEIYRISEKISADGISATVVSLSSHFLRSLFPRFDGIDKFTIGDFLLLCGHDSPNKQKHAFFTKCRSFCKKYLGGFNDSSVFEYLRIYKTIMTKVKSFLLSKFMASFNPKKVMDYIYSCYHTFEDKPLTDYFVLSAIKFSFGVDYVPCVDGWFGSDYQSALSARKRKYYEKLLPKHYNSVKNHW